MAVSILILLEPLMEGFCEVNFPNDSDVQKHTLLEMEYE